MPTSMLERIASHAARTTLDNLPEGVVRAATDLVVDAFGVGVAGSTTQESRWLRETAATWGRGDEAGIWGVPDLRLPAPTAALVTAHQLHCLEFDAIHEPAVVHPLTVVLPALAAAAERSSARGRPCHGADLLAATVVGVDVAAGLGDVTTSPLQFFRPGTAGALGAVAALGTLLRAEPEQTVAALGVVYGALSGTMQPHTEGAQVLALQVGLNARAALSAWDLAGAGFTGPKQVLEGRFGYFRLIEAAGRPEDLVARLGHQWEVSRTSVKPYPSGRATHSVLDMVLTLREQLCREGVTAADEVQSVEARVPPMVVGLVGRPATGLTPGAARLCLAYLVAAALVDGRVDLETCAPERLADPRLLDLAARVRVDPDDNPDPNAFDPQAVTLRLRDGRSLHLTAVASAGSPRHPLDEHQLAAKFSANLAAAGRADDAEKLCVALRALPQTQDAATVLELL